MSSSSLLTVSNLTGEQNKGIQFITDNDQGVIIADTGVGKTAIALQAIALKKGKWIVACPPKVSSGWAIESVKWEETKHLKIVHLSGDPDVRLSLLNTNADVYVISLNSLTWLLTQKHGCDSIIIDELSKASGKQASKLKNKTNDKINNRYGLTATPVSESFLKLYGMLRIIDKGVALGRNKQCYLTKYFYATDYKQFNWKLHPDSDKKIMAKIRHLICDIKTNKADTLPPIEYEEIVFDMPESTRAIYETMKTELLIEGDSDVVAVNLAVLSSKLRQISSGFVITEDNLVIEYDTERADTLIKILPQTALIIYEYTAQRVQIEKCILKAGKKAAYVFGGSDSEKALTAFKSGAVDYLVAQQNTLSHGVNNLQYATSNIIFIHPLWSNDNYKQSIGRIWRQGTPFDKVTVTTIVCDKTVDDLVLTRLDDKAINMTNFLQHLRG